MTRRRTARSMAATFGMYFLVVCLSLIWILPIVWTALTSLKPDEIITLMPPKWDFQPTLEHYANLTRTGSFLLFFRNSTAVSLSATIIALAVSIPAAYSVVRHGTGGTAARLAILGTRMIPAVVIAFPLFMLMTSMGVTKTILGLVLAQAASMAPFCAWLLIGFIQGVSRDFEESAMIDGCSGFSVIWRITLPMIRPGLATTAVLSFVISWNDLFFALVLTNGDTQTLPVAVTTFITGYAIKWGDLTAASMVILIPPVVLAFMVQKHLVRGLTLGGLK